MSDTKALTGVEIKSAEEGTVEAMFATYNVKDHDGDVTLPGAFEDGAQVRISAFGHASWGPSRGASSVPKRPVGKGRIHVVGDEAHLVGRYFLSTEDGREEFATIKEMAELQEWSYGFDIADSAPGEFQGEKVRLLKRMIVHEVSPVLLGAGLGTRTLAVKNHPGYTDIVGDDMKSFPDECRGVLGDVRNLVNRVENWGSGSDTKEGRTFSAANRGRLTEFDLALGELRTHLAALLADTDPNKHRDELLREWARYETWRATRGAGA